MIFDNLTLAAIALFVIISVFLISTKNRPRCKEEQPCSDASEKRTDH
ncbi:hypothetical protein [Sedimenticola selenatireducens]|jgi:hypothetical protein|nr:hypothetical protein [Sedimenticola selenatireducens]